MRYVAKYVILLYTTMATEVERIITNVLQRFDTDGNSEVTWSEFHHALLSEGIDTATVEEMRRAVFSNWDADCDQKLSLPEIQKLAEKWASFSGDQSHT